MKHSYYDASYHGSPTWTCEYCYEDKRINEQQGIVECPGADDAMMKKALKYDAAERREYVALIERRKREMYLINRFGELDEYR